MIRQAVPTPEPHPADQAPTPDDARGWSWFRFTRNAVVIAVTITLVVLFIVHSVVPNVRPKNFGVVREGEVYRSGRLTPAALAGVIEDHGVGLVIDFGAHDTGSPGDHREQRVCETKGVRRVLLPLVGDGTGDPNRYVEALRLLDDPDAPPTLLHCAAGAQRTSVAVALLRLREGATIDEAIEEARLYRHDPAKNPNLRPYLETWAQPILDAARTGVVIPYEPRPIDPPLPPRSADTAGVHG